MKTPQPSYLTLSCVYSSPLSMRTLAVKVKQLWRGRKVTSILTNMTTIVDTYRRRIVCPVIRQGKND